MTRKARERAYAIQMYALSEEHRVCKLSDDELKVREKEIWDNCFGKETT